jgi:hypothetical protein
MQSPQIGDKSPGIYFTFFDGEAVHAIRTFAVLSTGLERKDGYLNNTLLEIRVYN